MVKFDFYMPVKLVFGENALKKISEKLSKYRHAFIVTGKNSARLCGALKDVTDLLEDKKITYTVFDEVRENPLLSTCHKGGVVAFKEKADLVIGIGGGSPLDAAKAIAAFAANPEIAPTDIFNADLKDPIDLILIPTTAGTGSEGNNYSVLTLDDTNVKKTFKNDRSYAEFAVLDPKYTYSLNIEYTVSTALDAFCHCLESYLSPKSTDMSSMLAIYGAKKIWNAFSALKANSDMLITKTPDEAAKQMRCDLLAASLAAGIAINTTGTGFPHPLGYSLTLYNGIPHGRACAAFTGEYIKYNIKTEQGHNRIYNFAKALGTTPEEIAHEIPSLAKVDISLDKDTQKKYIDKVSGAGNYANSPYVISYEEMLEIYNRLFV